MLQHAPEHYEELIRFSSDGRSLEGKAVYHPTAERRGAVLLCPPHPDLGGNMGNNVIVGLGAHLASRGFYALSFNYLAIGGSGAAEKFARGEMRRKWSEVAEATEIASAFHEMRRRADGLAADVVGYSFGAYAAMEAVRRGLILPRRLIGICPPIDEMAGFPMETIDCRVSLIYGDQDFASPAERVLKMRGFLPDNFEVALLPDGDHFFIGQEQRIARVVADRLL